MEIILQRDVLDGKLSERELKIKIANAAVHQWMRKKENIDYLNQKKAEYVHDKGWTQNRTFKHELDIPPEAYRMLPNDLKQGEALKKWAKRYHPYLFFSSTC